MPAPKDPVKRKEWCDNISRGNIGKTLGKKQSIETIKKKVETRKRNGTYVNKHKGEKRSQFSPEWCKNISLGNKGRKPWNYGLKLGPHTEEHNQKISNANRGKPKPPFSKEHIDNIKKARANQIIPKRSDEHIQAMRLARSKQKIPFTDSKPERMMQIALALHNIKFEKHKMITNSLKFFHQVDIFIQPNICIEVDGDYWHRQPKILLRDSEVNHKLNLMGYNVIRIWEKDIKNNAEDCAMRIINLIRILGVVP